MAAITNAGTRQSSYQAVSAAVIGNVLEWYDFAVYGFMAGIIGKNFFPAGDAVSQLLSAFAVYGVGFLARPVGGIVIGRIGDTKGRKTALVLTIMLMAAGTVLIGIIPTYATIGIAGPLLILVARLMQGFSAGGEWGGSTAFIVEWAEEGERGFLGSFQQCSVSAGLLLGSGIAALTTTMFDPATMEAWGWRIPFLLGALLGPVGMYMRRNIDETPAYERAMRTAPAAPRSDDASPFGMAARAFGFTVLWTVAFYIFLNYMPTFIKTYAKVSSAAALWSNTIGLLVLVIAIPIMGKLSDRIGRKPLLRRSGAREHRDDQIVFGLIIAMFSGAGPAAISEIFPTRIRSTWMTTGYALSVAIFGGFAPYIATWLIAKTGSPISPVYYVIAAAVISTIVIARLKETAHEPLR